MKLFYVPEACSRGPHIALREVGAACDFEEVYFVDRETRQPVSALDPAARARGIDPVYGKGEDFRAINPAGLVPALLLDDGTTLTEGVSLYQYIADTYARGTLLGAPGTEDRALCLDMLGLIGRDVHEGVSLAMHTDFVPGRREAWTEDVLNRLDWFSRFIGDRPFLFDRFTVADIYLYLMWTAANGALRCDLNRWPNAARYMSGIRLRPAVNAAIEAEGSYPMPTGE